MPKSSLEKALEKYQKEDIINVDLREILKKGG